MTLESGTAAPEAELPTPAMVIDQRVAMANIARMAAYCREHGLNLRPHTKTHKSTLFARHQVDEGAIGLTVAKLGEARVMAACADDLLVAYPAVDDHRLAALAELAKSHTVRLAVDTLAAVQRIGEHARRAGVRLGVLVDIDVGFHRTGITEPAQALAVARAADAEAGVRFDGLFCFPGHVIDPPDEQSEALERIARQLTTVVDQLTEHGLAPAIVSGGSTPTALQSHHIPALTEIRPGTYVFYDWNCCSRGWCREQDLAAMLLCTVVSDAVPGKVVIDAGSKSLTSDRLVGDPEHGGHGRLSAYPEARIVRLSEEHGEVDVSQCARRPRVGERVHVVPNHICPCINLTDHVWLRDATGQCVVHPVDARGQVV